MSRRLKDKVAVVLGAGSSVQAGATEKQLPFYSLAKGKVFVVDLRREAAEETRGNYRG